MCYISLTAFSLSIESKVHAYCCMQLFPLTAVILFHWVKCIVLPLSYWWVCYFYIFAVTNSGTVNILISWCSCVEYIGNVDVLFHKMMLNSSPENFFGNFTFPASKPMEFILCFSVLGIVSLCCCCCFFSDQMGVKYYFILLLIYFSLNTKKFKHVFLFLSDSLSGNLTHIFICVLPS